jgi:hypothetical protein
VKYFTLHLLPLVHKFRGSCIGHAEMNEGQIIAIAAGVCLGLVLLFFVLWLGFKLLLLPLRLSWRFGRMVAEQIGPILLLLLLIWTIALAPDPFVYLWRWFLHFGQALLVDLPRELTLESPRLATACSESVSICLGNLGIEAQRLWSNAIGPAISTFDVPPNLVHAALVFAAGATIAFAIARLPLAASREGSPSDITKIAALTASFVLALYLAIVAIVAIPEFGQKVPDLTQYRSSLADQLTKATPSNELKYSFLTELAGERDQLPNFDALRPSVPERQSSLFDASSRQSWVLESVESRWSSQLDTWNQSLTRLTEAAQALPAEARKFTQTAQSFFQVSNEGHIGETATQRHVTVLANSFILWLSDYHAALDTCAARLRDGLAKLRSFHATMVPLIRLMGSSDLTSSDSRALLDTMNKPQSSFIVPACFDIKPVDRNYLPARSGPAETLGVFGVAAAWLLRTESPELALIVGLLGFGFFGALAASFIREFAGTPGNQLPPVSFIIPALVRGVGAAILIFLLAKGGTAILTRGDATPNAYAIFFACFVAAVFSEDVWSWARTKQRDQLAARESQEPSTKGDRRDQLPAGGDQPPAVTP